MLCNGRRFDTNLLWYGAAEAFSHEQEKQPNNTTIFKVVLLTPKKFHYQIYEFQPLSIKPHKLTQTILRNLVNIEKIFHKPHSYKLINSKSQYTQ